MKRICVFLLLLLPFWAFSQIYEPFNAPEITANYPWQADPNKFRTEGGFLRLYDSNKASEAIACLYGAILGENEWIFRVKSGYTTTNANFFRVYLWSDKTDLNAHPKAYFVEIGKGQKKIALCRTIGNSVVDTLASRAINNLTKDFDIHIKVTTTANGTISLHARSDAKPDYTLIGTASYTPQAMPGYFILYCKYSADHAKDKYFGPVRIKNFWTNTPAEPSEGADRLRLLSIWQENASTLDLAFNRVVDPVHASFSLNYLGNADEIYIADDAKQLRLVWDGTMEKGKTYTLSYSGLYDNEGTAYRGISPPFIATKDAATHTDSKHKAGDVIINEVMADPKGAAGLPETEYVELYNTTEQDITLTGWAFRYGDKLTPLASAIPAGGYAVLFRSGRAIQVDEGGIAIPLPSFPSALANTGKKLSLVHKENTIIDEIAYPKAIPGYAWERTGETWKTSTDSRGGTPGSKNAQTPAFPEEEEEEEEEEEDNTDDTDNTVVMPREIVFTELLPEPKEGGSEYIELYNRSELVLDLTGLAIAVRKSDQSLSTNYPLVSVKKPLGAGEYVLLTKSADGVFDFFLTPSPEAIHELKLPILSNTSAQLVLFRSADKEVIDEVHYSSKWHSALVKDKKGIALEKIDPDGDSQDPDNWTSAATLSGGGTPGYKNSQSVLSAGEKPTGIETPNYFPTTGNYGIAYRLDRPGYLCRANIYDTSGRRIVEVANQELPGTEGIVTWDGFASGGHKPSMGVYIFHAELYHPEGGRKSYKKVFLVR